MASEEKRLELERPVQVGRLVLVPIAWTVGRPALRGRNLSVAMCREAFGVIVLDGENARAFLVDGRVMSLDELAVECPSLRDALDALRQGCLSPRSTAM